MPTFDNSPRVFVVQESPGKNLAPALQYGQLVPVFVRQVTVEAAQSALHDYGDADYILAIGSPTAMVIAVAVALKANHGRCDLLEWDRQTFSYKVIHINIPQS